MGRLTILFSPNPSHEWDTDDPASVAHCKQLFYDVLGEGNVAYKTDRNGKQTPTKTFDPDAESITISLQRS